jgi:hypothetical protein
VVRDTPSFIAVRLRALDCTIVFLKAGVQMVFFFYFTEAVDWHDKSVIAGSEPGVLFIVLQLDLR